MFSNNYQGFRKHNFPKHLSKNAVNSTVQNFCHLAILYLVLSLRVWGFFNKFFFTSAVALFTSCIIEFPCLCQSYSDSIAWTWDSPWGQFYLENRGLCSSLLKLLAASRLKQQSRELAW